MTDMKNCELQDYLPIYAIRAGHMNQCSFLSDIFRCQTFIGKAVMATTNLEPD